MLASIVALLWCYAFAFGRGNTDAIGRSTLVLTIPLVLLWGAATCIGSLLALLDLGLHWISDGSPTMPENGWTFIVVTLLVVSYSIAVSLSLRSTMTIARVWRTGPYDSQA